MNPFDAIGHLALGLIRNHQLQDWCKLAASLIATSLVAFVGTFGLVGVSMVMAGWSPVMAIALALFNASTMAAVCFLAIWLKSPLTKGIPILYPGKIEAARIEELTKDGLIFNPNEQKK